MNTYDLKKIFKNIEIDKKEINWNPWSGCYKCSDGCKNCYTYNRNIYYGKDPEDIHIVKSKFKLPIIKDIYREYKIESGTNFNICEDSDFFIEEADEWRPEIWKMIKERDDCLFKITTKKAERIYDCLPSDWNDGYENVTINLSVENQKNINEKIPIFNEIKIKHRTLMICPILEDITINEYIKDHLIEDVYVGGESGFYKARVCDFQWILNLKKECEINKINFKFIRTGSNFKIGKKIYKIKVNDEFSQADKANINLNFK